MANDNHDVNVLNRLITAVLDSVDGYEEASQDARQGQLDEFFDLRFKQRYDLSIKMQDHVRSLGGTPTSKGTLLASAHRTFTKLKTAIAKGDGALIAEARRGEMHLNRQLQSALSDRELSLPTRTLIEQAYDAVRADADAIRIVAGTNWDQI